MILYSYQGLKDYSSYSATDAWLRAKSKTSTWRCDVNTKLLFIDFFFFRIEWLPYFGSLTNQEKHHLFFKNKFGKPTLLITRLSKNDFELFTRKKKIFVPLVLYTLKKESLTSIIQLTDWGRHSLRKNWKRNLKRSYKQTLTDQVVNLKISKDLPEICNLIESASKYKSLRIPHKPELLALLGDKYIKILGVRSRIDNKLIAIRAFFKSGNTAIDFIAAAASDAFKVYATYKLAYELIESAKDEGFSSYDLAGIDKEENIGVYNFKLGLGGGIFSNGSLSLVLRMSSFKKP